MTLVAARIAQGAIFIVGDTKLTFGRTKEKVPITRGVLKTKIIADDLTISFAGNQYIADVALRSITRKDAVSDIVELLLTAHKSTDPEDTADFIVASLGSAPSLFVVKDGKAARSETAWIGSAEAFKLMREYELGHRSSKPKSPTGVYFQQLSAGNDKPPPGIETYSRMLRSLNDVVDDEAAADVGGFAIPVIGWKDRFRYMSYADLRTHAVKTSGTVPFGTAHDGSYAHDVVAISGDLGVSSYFLQGNFGIIYRDVDGGFPKAELVLNVSAIDFVEQGSKLAGATVSTFYADVRVLCQSALDKLSLGDTAGALRDVERAFAINGQSADAWRCRGDIHMKAGEIDEALTNFKMAVQLGPNDAVIWNKLGIAWNKVGDLSQAIAAFDSALNVDHAYWRALANRGIAYSELDQKEYAIRDLTSALSHEPNNVVLWRNKAAVLASFGQLVEATDCIQKALQVSPTDAAAQLALSQLRSEMLEQSTSKGQRPTNV